MSEWLEWILNLKSHTHPHHVDILFQDPLVALLCGIVALLMGLYSVCVLWRVKRVPICSCSWWLMSRGDGSGDPSFPDPSSKMSSTSGGDVVTPASSSDVEMQENENGDPTKLSAEVV